MMHIRGFSFAEVAATSFVVIIFALLGVDVCLLTFACSINDQACRSAVRSAAQAHNGSQALLLAQASVRNRTTDGVFISPITLVSVNYNDYGGSPPVGQAPFVTVITTVTVTLPTSIFFFGSSFGKVFQFNQIYTSPIVRTKYVLP